MSKILIALSWGHQFPKPGLSNEVMAQEIRKINNNFDALLVQHEIGQALGHLGFSPDCVIGQSGVYINTFQVIKNSINWLRDRNLLSSQNEIWVMCHPAHWRGIKMVLRKFSITARRVPVDIPYDSDSHQWYTRGPFGAFIGKIVHGIGYLFRGEIKI